MEEEKKSSTTASFLKGVLVGGIIGAGLALLYAPKSGKELREDIKKKSSELKDEADKRLSNAHKIATQIIEEGLNKADELKKQADEKIREAKSKAANFIAEQKEKLRAGMEKTSIFAEEETPAAKSKSAKSKQG